MLFVTIHDCVLIFLLPTKGARREVQGGALAPLWILLFRALYSCKESDT